MRPVKHDSLVRVAVGVLLSAFIYVVYTAIHQPVIVAGDMAPQFTVVTQSGRIISLPGFGGKLLVLNFWSSSCGPCVEETASLSRFAQEFATKGVVVLAISVDKDQQAYNNFLLRFSPSFFVARDLSLPRHYNAYFYPETYIIGVNGKVLEKLTAQTDWMDARVTQYINSLLQGPGRSASSSSFIFAMARGVRTNFILNGSNDPEDQTSVQ